MTHKMRIVFNKLVFYEFKLFILKSCMYFHKFIILVYLIDITIDFLSFIRGSES